MKTRKITQSKKMTSKSKNYTLTRLAGTSPTTPYYKHSSNTMTTEDKAPPLPPSRRPKLTNNTDNVPVPKQVSAPALRSRPLPQIPHTQNFNTNINECKENDAPPLPSRNKASWTQPNNVFEERFKFHRANEFPIPNPVLHVKKYYPSQHKKDSPRQKLDKPPAPPEV